MANKKDLKALGEVYGNLGKETTVVAESADKLTVGDKKAGVGEADLKDGGGTKEGGFEEPEVDVTKVGKGKNPYNVKGLSYGDDNSPTLETDQPKVIKPGEPGYEEEDPEKDPEEDEESLSKELEIAKDGLNKYMAKKSIFDELYAKVISEDFGMEEVDDLDALGIDDATPDSELADDETEGEDEITVTLDKELARTLLDILTAAVGDDEGDDVEGDLEEVGDDNAFEGDFEEDNEGAPTAHTTSVDMGVRNKVGNVTGLGGSGAGTADTGKTAEKFNATVKDGKQNKVGNLSQGQAAFGDLKVQPAKKA
jgi:hypothetical protein